jgi:carbamate kinase
METLVIALGGNAILQSGQRGTTDEQFANVDMTARQIARIVASGYRVVVAHGNGPQAGALLIQQEETEAMVPGQSLAACGAMTQGSIGWMIQNRLTHYLRAENLATEACSLVTQVLVSRDDPDFEDPSKPVGPFYTEKEAQSLQRTKSYCIKLVKPGCEKGWRRVVPSPEPQEIVEEKAIKSLLADGFVVIASGGGGIPVARESDGSLLGVNAVIDKDKASYTLARAINADRLMILTDVERVSLRYGTPHACCVDAMSVAEAEGYLAEGHFLKGSMGPKVEACLRFVRWSGRPAIIGALDKAVEALQGKSGTTFLP